MKKKHTTYSPRDMQNILGLLSYRPSHTSSSSLRLRLVGSLMTFEFCKLFLFSKLVQMPKSTCDLMLKFFFLTYSHFYS